MGSRAVRGQAPEAPEGTPEDGSPGADRRLRGELPPSAEGSSALPQKAYSRLRLPVLGCAWGTDTTDVPPRRRLVVLSLIAVSFVAMVVHSAQPPSSFTGWGLIGLLWLASMVMYALAWAPPNATVSLRDALTSMSRPEQAGFVGILLLALALRVYQLEYYPLTLNSDEAQAALRVREVVRGTLTSPFTSVIVALGHFASLPSFGQAIFLQIFGDTLHSARLFSALAGVATVAAVYVLARWQFGVVCGAITGVVLATLPSHVFWSRSALTNVLYTLGLVAALGFVLLAVQTRARWAFALAGLAIGLSQYTYQGARAILIIVGALLLVDLLANRGSLRAWLARFRVLVGGIAVAFLPLLVNYLLHPLEVTARVNQVSIFASGWLAAEMGRTGSSALEITAGLVWRTAMAYVSVAPRGIYEPYQPLLPPAGALLLGIGLAVAVTTARRGQRGALALVIAFLIIVVTVGLTENPPASARIMIADPIVAMLVGLGSMWVVSVMAQGNRSMAAFSVLVIAGFLGVHGAHFYFVRLDPTLDDNSAITSEIGYFMQAQPSEMRIVLAAVPRLSCRSHASIEFLSPGRVCTDVQAPSQGARLEAGPNDIVIAVPERRQEIEERLGVNHGRTMIPLGRAPHGRDRSFAYLP